MKFDPKIKRKLLFSLILIFALQGFSQTVVSSCLAVDSIIKKYRKTADKLSILRCEKINNTYKDSVEVNDQLSKEYLNALLAVYNATAFPARDSIVSLNITLDYLSYPATNMISIQVDSNQTWLKNLRNNVIPCGNTGIDYLINRFFLKKDAYYDYFQSLSYHGVRFKTDSNYYMNRLADKFNALYQQGVVSAAPQTQSSPNFSLTDSVNISFKEFTYGFNWGDCISGCLYHRFWKFRVNTDCSVEYKGSYGDPLPPEIYSGLSETSIENLATIYPNPVTNNVFISLKGLTNAEVRIEIMDLNGKVVFENSFNNSLQQNSLDVSTLPNGLYLFHIMSENQSFTRKIFVNRP